MRLTKALTPELTPSTPLGEVCRWGTMRAEARMRLTKALSPELKLSLGVRAETRRFGTTPRLTKLKLSRRFSLN
jgi:hypothetical protein